jgi:hypothetical protein
MVIPVRLVQLWKQEAGKEVGVPWIVTKTKLEQLWKQEVQGYSVNLEE